MVGGTVLAVVVILIAWYLVVKLLGGRVQSGWCHLDGWWHCVGSCCDLDCLVLGLWLRASFRSSSCLAAGCNRVVSSRWLVALCRQLLCSVIAWYLGSGCGA